VPIRGWFLIEQLTGAVVETSLRTSRGPATGEMLVRYRRDPVLGLWVPAQMRETFKDGYLYANDAPGWGLRSTRSWPRSFGLAL
jgi:hypothetical protein